MGLSENKVPPTPIIYHQCPYWHSHLQGVPHFQTHPNHIKSYQIISNHTITIYKPGISRNYVPFFLNLRQHLSVHGAVKSRLKLPISSMGYDENFYTHLDWRIWIWIWRIWMMNLCVRIYIYVFTYTCIYTHCEFIGKYGFDIWEMVTSGLCAHSAKLMSAWEGDHRGSQWEAWAHDTPRIAVPKILDQKRATYSRKWAKWIQMLDCQTLFNIP